MNYMNAVKAARADRFIRHPDMSPGWTIGKLPKFKSDLWCFNPHTGSEYLYRASGTDKIRTDWFIAPDRIHRESLGNAKS
jgi:hypothetical protein